MTFIETRKVINADEVVEFIKEMYLYATPSERVIYDKIICFIYSLPPADVFDDMIGMLQSWIKFSEASHDDISAHCYHLVWEDLVARKNQMFRGWEEFKVNFDLEFKFDT